MESSDRTMSSADSSIKRFNPHIGSSPKDCCLILLRVAIVVLPSLLVLHWNRNCLVVHQNIVMNCFHALVKKAPANRYLLPFGQPPVNTVVQSKK